MFYTYILQSKKTDELYVGFTNNLKKRFKEHNLGLNFSTKRFKPWGLIYYEACLSELDAKRREHYLKTSQGGRLLKRRLKDYMYQQKSKNLMSRNSTTG